MTEEQRAKDIGQFKLQLNGVFSPFHAYGMDVFVPASIDQVVKLALQFHERLSGHDVPIIIDRKTMREG